MSENLFLGDATPDGYIGSNATELTPYAGVKTTLPVNASNFNYIKISPVGGISTRARTVEILKNGQKRYFGDFGVSNSAPMETLLYSVPEDVAEIQIFYQTIGDTATGLFIQGISIKQPQLTYQQQNHNAEKGAVTANERHLGKIILDLDPLSERFAVVDRRKVHPLFHGRTEHYRPITVPEKYGSTDELCVLMFDDSGEYNIAVADKVQAELFDANQIDVNSNE